MPDLRSITYVLRPGATQEEQWSWTDVEAMCRSGELGPGARIFDGETGAWTLIEDSEFGPLLPEESPARDLGEAAIETLREDYEATLERIESEPGNVDPRIEAARMALSLEDPDAAMRHFQAALDANPFHPRVASQARSSLKPSCYRTLRFLERPDAPWDDLGGLIAWPWSRGPAWALAPWPVLLALSFLPGGTLVMALAAAVWTLLLARAAARGEVSVPGALDYRDDAIRGLSGAIAALGSVTLVAGGFGAVAWLVNRLSGDTSRGVADAIGSSPILVVLFVVALLACMPVAWSRATVGHRPWGALSVWSWPSTAIAMESEYVMSELLLCALAFVAGGIVIATAGIPVVDQVVHAGVLSMSAPIVAMIVGRLAGRNIHRIETRIPRRS